MRGFGKRVGGKSKRIFKIIRSTSEMIQRKHTKISVLYGVFLFLTKKDGFKKGIKRFSYNLRNGKIAKAVFEILKQ